AQQGTAPPPMVGGQPRQRLDRIVVALANVAIWSGGRAFGALDPCANRCHAALHFGSTSCAVADRHALVACAGPAARGNHEAGDTPPVVRTTAGRARYAPAGLPVFA